MKKPFINTAHGWSGDDENTVNRTAIELSLEQFKSTNDPICLAQIIHHLDFHGVDEAKEVLSDFLTKEIRKTVSSAIANAENNNQYDIDKLIVKEAYCGKKVVMKRFRPRAKGRAAPILKPYSTVTIILSEAKKMESHGTKS